MNKELYQKYLDNTLTPEELTRFRALLSSSSDETLTSVIDDHWLLHDPSPDTAYSRQEAAYRRSLGSYGDRQPRRGRHHHLRQ